MKSVCAAAPPPLPCRRRRVRSLACAANAHPPSTAPPSRPQAPLPSQPQHPQRSTRRRHKVSGVTLHSPPQASPPPSRAPASPNTPSTNVQPVKPFPMTAAAPFSAGVGWQRRPCRCRCPSPTPWPSQGCRRRRCRSPLSADRSGCPTARRPPHSCRQARTSRSPTPRQDRWWLPWWLQWLSHRWPLAPCREPWTCRWWFRLWRWLR
jgi:hypothetical protein